jgi:hypothetical protein
VLTIDEQAALLAVLNDEYRRFVIVALGTGLGNPSCSGSDLATLMPRAA